MPDESDSSFEQDGKSQRLSYKFQRLRERLREAIRSGDLQGKLPGERQLAKRFRVNAKTLSKALTDLAAEGLLDRSIGRGTYVRGTEPEPAAKMGKWLLLVDDPAKRHFLHDHLARLNPELVAASAIQSLRPSDIAGVSAVIDVSTKTPDAAIRDLLVRSVPTVVVARQASAYSTHSVAIDRQLGAANLAREMALLGHRRFFVAEGDGLSPLHDVVRQIVVRYDSGATVENGSCNDAPAAVEHGATAIICGCTFAAADIMNVLARQDITVPQRVSVGCAGATGDTVPCSGYFVPMTHFAESIARVLADHAASRPVNLWLAGAYIEKQTIDAPARPAATASGAVTGFGMQDGAPSA
ncbi:MAG TPA: GntR family transcriptional regulator [Tepidisphaeraceae bacterium]|nr:GntR family transcriptional regulator [Tepidisphaeraceae bacterium]